MNILVVSPAMTIYGGAEVLVVRLVNYLSKAGHNVSLLISNITPEIESELIDVRVINLEVKISSLFLTEIYALRRFMKKNKHQYDIVNVHNFPAELALSGQTPCVWMCNEPPLIRLNPDVHGQYSLKRFYKLLLIKYEQFYLRNKKFTTIVADQFNQVRFKTIYQQHAEIIPYGVDADFFATQPENLPERNDDQFIIVQVGMIQELKNQLESLKVINVLKAEIPNIYLVIAGHAIKDYKDKLDDYITKHSLEKYIKFTGHVNREDIRKLYYLSDVFLHPVKAQGGWLSPFEAMATGIPVVVSKELTAADMIAENNLGFVTNDYVKTIKSIFHKTDKLMVNKKTRINWVQQNFTWDNFSENMLQQFQKILEKPALGS